VLLLLRRREERLPLLEELRLHANSSVMVIAATRGKAAGRQAWTPFSFERFSFFSIRPIAKSTDLMFLRAEEPAGWAKIRVR
jgi:hypothetical protein